MVARYRDILDSESGSGTPSRENSVRGGAGSSGSLASSKQSLASEGPAESKGTQTLKSRLAKQPIKEQVTSDPGPTKATNGSSQESSSSGADAKPEQANKGMLSCNDIL